MTSKVKVSKRTVISPNMVCFKSVELETPFDEDYIINPTPMKTCLISPIYGSGKFLNLNVINDSENFVNFWKGKAKSFATLITTN